MRAALVDAAIARRELLWKAGDLEAFRLVNGVGDRLPGIFVDQFGPLLLARADAGADAQPVLARLRERCGLNDAATAELRVRERALRFVVRPLERGAPGLFLDQRENRARVAELCAMRVAKAGACAMLNTFAYTCSFSVAATQAGARTTSVDLSTKYLDWGKQNFEANRLDPAAHEFARGDALVYLEIAVKKGRRFDVLVLDPPTFSTSKQRGVFQVERHFARLFELACRVAAPGAALLCSHNQRTFTRAALASKLRDGARAAGRKIAKLAPFSPPPDFPGPDGDNPAARGFWVELQG